MLKIRLSMGGAKKRPVYKIVVADSRFPRDGRFIEKVGFFNPLLPKTKKERVNLQVERIKHWISKGAKPTLRVSRILGEAEVFPMPPKGNNPLKAIPKKDRKKDKSESEKPAVEVAKTEPKKEESKKEAPKAAKPKAESKKEETKKDTAPKTEPKKKEPSIEVQKVAAPKEEPKKEEPNKR